MNLLNHASNNEIIDQASSILDLLSGRINEDIYLNTTKTLSFLWLPENNFIARTEVHPDYPENHKISFSYGVPIEIYQDAFDFIDYAVNHRNAKWYSELYGDIYEKNKNLMILPVGINSEQAISLFFELSILWIFLHETAHIIQDHGRIRTDFSNLKNATPSLIINEITDNKDITGETAWIYHATELSADYEATILLINYITLNRSTFEKSDLWMLICCLMCLFFRFHKNIDEPIKSEAKGSHPDPSLRIALVIESIKDTLSDNNAYKFVPWAEDKNELNKIINNAHINASICCNSKYNNNDGIPEILKKCILRVKTLKNIENN